MVIDDDSTSNMICKYMIQKHVKSAVISYFEQPEKALEEIQTHYNKEDEDLKTILFLDINMPTMTGWEFLDKFKTFDPVIQNHFVIYILTSAIQDFEKEIEEYPFVAGFLAKPIKSTTIKEIREALPV